MSKHTDETVRCIIENLITHGGNVNYVSRELGYNYGAVARYKNLWKSGKLSIEGLPLYQPEQTLTSDVSSRDANLKLAALQAQNRLLQEEVERLGAIAELADRVKKETHSVPNWLTKAPAKGGRAVIPTAFLSDVHLDEVIKPEQVNYVNAYDRQIATKRLANFFNNTIELSRDYLSGFKYEGIVLPLGGDIFAGNIHDELVETNAGTIFESMNFWADPLASGIKHLRDVFGRVYIPCVVGNHGRRKKKPHAKNRAQDNYEYLFYHLLKRLLSEEKGIEFAISEAPDFLYLILSTRYLLTHGDQFRGGSGIAGMWSALMLGDSRKRTREAAVNRPYDYMVMGHWHQLSFMKNIIVNGSVSGYDEYANVSNFSFEPPQQAYWITDSTHGVTLRAPIHVQDKEEKYNSHSGISAVKNPF